jgi:hypothetical protein
VPPMASWVTREEWLHPGGTAAAAWEARALPPQAMYGTRRSDSGSEEPVQRMRMVERRSGRPERAERLTEFGRGVRPVEAMVELMVVEQALVAEGAARVEYKKRMKSFMNRKAAQMYIQEDAV